MKSEIRFVAPNGAPVPVAEHVGAATIADWFGSDIQYSEKLIDEWLNIFEMVSNGSRESGYQGTGNTHSVMAIDDWIFIECEHLEQQKVFLTRQQVSSALELYRAFLKNSCENNFEPPTPFIVEYESEGQDAFDRYLETGGSLGA